MDYTLQPGDVLQVSVWKEADLQGEFLIRPDGGFSFPLVGDIKAAGKTVVGLRKELSKRIQRYVPDAVVNVSLRQPQGHRIYVVGKVNRPGEYLAMRPLDVMQALSMAGGTTPFAATNRIKVLRRADGKQTAIPFRYSDVEDGDDLGQNIVLQGGDVVVVP
jgi:polysaccharide export outer membrane protein